MLGKLSSFVSSTHCGSQFTCLCQCVVYTSSFPRRFRSGRAVGVDRSIRPWSQRRSYAEVRGGINRRKDDEEELPWPKPEPPDSVPTPYQIFNQQKGSPYSKARFYELVKLYHPDRHRYVHEASGVRRLSEAVRLERYRLVIAANAILSDPAKRSAYDARGGVWWTGQAPPGTAQNHDGARRGWTSPGAQAWRDNPHEWSPNQNATWEDWERWYQGNTRGKQEPVFVGNNAFISIVIILATLGGVVEAMRYGDHSRNFFEQRDRVHMEASRDLMRSRHEAMKSGRRDEMIQRFMSMREPGSFFENGREEMLAAPGNSPSGDAKERSDASELR